MSHTPGPWVAAAHFAERQGARTYIPILRPGGDPVPIAVVHRDVDGFGRGEGEANACLIEAATDLLRAAQLVLARLSELNRDDEAGIRMVLANAIEKAEPAALPSEKREV